MLIKEIEDIESVIENDLNMIKRKQFNTIDSIKEVKIENKIEDKVKMLKTYFSNRKKTKFIIKL